MIHAQEGLLSRSGVQRRGVELQCELAVSAGSRCHSSGHGVIQRAVRRIRVIAMMTLAEVFRDWDCDGEVLPTLR